MVRPKCPKCGGSGWQRLDKDEISCLMCGYTLRGATVIAPSKPLPDGKRQTVKLKCADIQIGRFSVRARINDAHVDRLIEAMERGAKLPPVGVQTGTLQLIYGQHRLKATRLLLGSDAEIEAIVYEVDDKGAAELALAENAKHGLPLSDRDLYAAFDLVERLGLDHKQAEELLQIRRGTMESLRVTRYAAEAEVISRVNRERPTPAAKAQKAASELLWRLQALTKQDVTPTLAKTLGNVEEAITNLELGALEDMAS